jgi:cbb3-type cytochrome oxidase maturation protein
MNLPLAALILIFLVVLGASLAIGAFFWAVRNKQFKDLNAGAYVIFDEDEPIGKMTDNVFGIPERNHKRGEQKG